MKAPPRVVLDTNVVLSALLFGGGWAGRVRADWQRRQFVPLASATTAQELVRVLVYPKFGLTPADREQLLADYLPWVEVVRVPATLPAAPACRDPFDAAFVHLAIAGKARALVTGDRDLLALAGAPGLCPVLSVAEFCRLYVKD